jgi:hypothetical protein
MLDQPTQSARTLAGCFAGTTVLESPKATQTVIFDARPWYMFWLASWLWRLQLNKIFFRIIFNSFQLRSVTARTIVFLRFQRFTTKLFYSILAGYDECSMRSCVSHSLLLRRINTCCHPISCCAKIMRNIMRLLYFPDKYIKRHMVPHTVKSNRPQSAGYFGQHA